MFKGKFADVSVEKYKIDPPPMRAVCTNTVDATNPDLEQADPRIPEYSSGNHAMLVHCTSSAFQSGEGPDEDGRAQATAGNTKRVAEHCKMLFVCCHLDADSPKLASR